MKANMFLFMILPSFAATAITDVMKVKIAGNNYWDETAIRFLLGATPGFDSNWDAHKFFSLNPNVPQIYTRSNTTDLGINALPPLVSDTTVELHLYVPVAGTYTLQGIETGAFAQGVSVMLEDLTDGSLYDLRSGNLFSFTMDTAGSTTPVRFVVHFTAAPVITSAVDTDKEDIVIVFEDQAIQIEMKGFGKRTASLYDFAGKLYHYISSADSNFSIDITGLPAGGYIVRIENNGKVITKKIFIP